MIFRWSLLLVLLPFIAQGNPAEVPSGETPKVETPTDVAQSAIKSVLDLINSEDCRVKLSQPFMREILDRRTLTLRDIGPLIKGYDVVKSDGSSHFPNLGIMLMPRGTPADKGRYEFNVLCDHPEALDSFAAKFFKGGAESKESLQSLHHDVADKFIFRIHNDYSVTLSYSPEDIDNLVVSEAPVAVLERLLQKDGKPLSFKDLAPTQRLQTPMINKMCSPDKDMTPPKLSFKRRVKFLTKTLARRSVRYSPPQNLADCRQLVGAYNVLFEANKFEMVKVGMLNRIKQGVRNIFPHSASHSFEAAEGQHTPKRWWQRRPKQSKSAEQIIKQSNGVELKNVKNLVE